MSQIDELTADVPVGDQATSTTSSEHRRFLFVVLALVVIGVWLLPARRSLWIDEAGTYWVVKDGLSQTWHRALTFQGQSPLFYLVEWVARAATGRSEIGLRLPSLISSVVSLFLLFRLSRRLIGEEGAWIASIIFACLGSVAVEASEARPYAFALMLLLASTLSLVRWLDVGKLRYGAAYAILVAATVYAHYLFVLPVAAHLVYFWYRRHNTPVRPRTYAAVLVCAAALASPSFVQLASLLGRRHSLEIPTSLAFKDFIYVLAPSSIVIGILGGWLIARWVDRCSLSQIETGRWDRALIATWWVVPPLALYFFSVATRTTLFVPRYFLSAAPALALIPAWWISRLLSERARRIVVTAVVLLSVLVLPDVLRAQDEGWRAALHDANSLSLSRQTPILIRTALTESWQATWLLQPERASYLLSPIYMYPIRGRAYPMPLYLNAATREYLNRLASNVLIGSQRFVTISREFDPFELWIEGRMEPLGFRPTFSNSYGKVSLTLFERDPKSR